MRKQQKQKSAKTKISWTKLIIEGLAEIVTTVIAAYIIDKLI